MTTKKQKNKKIKIKRTETIQVLCYVSNKVVLKLRLRFYVALKISMTHVPYLVSETSNSTILSPFATPTKRGIHQNIIFINLFLLQRLARLQYLFEYRNKFVYVIGLHAVQFGNNWMKKIPRTAKIGRGRRPSPIWLSEEFFESNYFQIGQACSPLTY